MLSDTISSFYSTFILNRLTESQYNSLLSTSYFAQGYNGFDFYLTDEDGETEEPILKPVNSFIWWESYSEPPKRNYVITFDANGGTASFYSKTVKDGSCIGEFPCLQFEGHQFYGWIDPYTSLQVSESTIVSSNINVQAKWDTETFYITVETDQRFAQSHGSGIYTYGSTQYISIGNIHPAIYFKNWDDGYTINPRTIIVSGERTYIGTLGRTQYTATVSPGSGGTGGGSGTYAIRVQDDDIGPEISIDFSQNWPNKQDYYISSWTNTQVSGGGNPYFNGKTLVIPLSTYGDFTMTPNWAKI